MTNLLEFTVLMIFNISQNKGSRRNRIQTWMFYSWVGPQMPTTKYQIYRDADGFVNWPNFSEKTPHLALPGIEFQVNQLSVNSNSDFFYLKVIKIISNAQFLSRIAHFYHNFMTVDAIGLKICLNTCETQPENIAPKYSLYYIGYVWQADLTWRVMTGSFISAIK